MHSIVPYQRRVVIKEFFQSGTKIDAGREFMVHEQLIEQSNPEPMWLCIWDVKHRCFHDGEGVCKYGHGYWVFEDQIERYTIPISSAPQWEL